MSKQQKPKKAAKEAVKPTPDPELTVKQKKVQTARLKAQQDLELRRGQFKDRPVTAGVRETYGGGNFPFTLTP